MKLVLDLNSLDGYRTFLKVKSLPVYRFVGREAWFPDEYAGRVGVSAGAGAATGFVPRPWLFDYQRDISRLAVRKRKFAVFADCGLGKTLILLEFARHAAESLAPDRCVLVVAPLMVVGQTVGEAVRFYGADLPIDVVAARDLPGWLASGTGRVGITNYEAITDRVRPGRLGALILDESSMLKSHYGRWGQRLIKMGRGLDWKLCLTGTPAPNDRIEYANHAVFLDRFPTVNSFLSRFFVNRGKTDARWELKPHALRPFYRALSDWSIFLTDPAVYGWKDNCAALPPIEVSVEDVPLTPEQKDAAGFTAADLLGRRKRAGGIVSRTKLAQIAKGRHRGKPIPTHKPGYIRDLVAEFAAGGEQTLVWCRFNPEQDGLAAVMPGAGDVSGKTPLAERRRLIGAFQRGDLTTILSKPKVMGFGLNLQAATRQVFSSLHDSYEEYYQAVKRSNRYGSTRPLRVHIPVTEIEVPMVETVLRKAARVQDDAREQERLFKEVGLVEF